MTPLEPADLGTILLIWAHPDDETYLAGAVMAAAAAAGQRVVCVSATLGELGTSDPEAWPPARLGRLRAWEAAAAMAVLGVTEHHALGWPDGGLASIPAADGVAAIACLLDDVRPDTILTFGPDGQTFHPDHIAVHRWVSAAWAKGGAGSGCCSAPTRRRISPGGATSTSKWGVYMTDDRPVATPDGHLALRYVPEGAALDQKLAALSAMASQTADARALLGPAAYAAMAAEEAFRQAPCCGGDGC